MKTYFCKYLPVEGEIALNDFITDGYKIWQWKDDCSLLGRKKVKLFLCSRDIDWTEGDEFDEEEVKQVSEIYGWEDTPEVEEAFNNFFVKSLATTSTHFNIKHWIKDKNEGDSVVFEVFKNVYQIKGSCGHYH